MRKLSILLLVLCFFSAMAQDIPQPDPAFGDTGRRAIPMFTSQAGAFFGNRSLKVYPNNDILVVSTTLRDVPNNDRDLFTARLTSNGNLDLSYGDTGTVRVDCGARIEFCNAATLTPDGKAVLVGVQRDLFSSIDKILLVRINANGTLDSSFGGSGIVISDMSPVSSISEGKDVKVLNDGKILVAARVRIVSGNPGFEQAIIKYKQNGTLDSTFGTNGVRYVIDPATADNADKLLVQADNKILLFGITTQSGIVKLTLARTDENGTLDPQFGTAGTVTITQNPSVNINTKDAYLQPDQKFIVAGNTTANSTLQRFNTNGSIDSTFGSNGIATVPVAILRSADKVLPAPNNKLYVIGYEFNTVKIARFTANGQLDNTFGTDGVASVGTANPSSSDLTGEVLSDGSILVCGKWTVGGIDNISVLKVNIVPTVTGLDDVRVVPMVVYPNPANNMLMVQTKEQITQLELIDAEGRIVQQQAKVNALDVSNVPQGAYLLKCTGVNGAVTSTRVQVVR